MTTEEKYQKIVNDLRTLIDEIDEFIDNEFISNYLCEYLDNFSYELEEKHTKLVENFKKIKG